jgi:hypothetical protein
VAALAAALGVSMDELVGQCALVGV